MKYRKPEIGETIYCWAGSKEYIAHRHMLYLGPDKEAKDKLLVQCADNGWKIITLSQLLEGKYRPLGRYNLIEEKLNKKRQPTWYTYRFYDKDKPTDISVRKFRNVWRIETEFDLPSWSIKEEDKDA